MTVSQNFGDGGVTAWAANAILTNFDRRLEPATEFVHTC
jgi:hypothetical protein